MGSRIMPLPVIAGRFFFLCSNKKAPAHRRGFVLPGEIPAHLHEAIFQTQGQEEDILLVLNFGTCI